MIRIACSLLLPILGFGLVLGSRFQTANPPMSRATALKILKGCATRPVTFECSEDTAEYLITLYKRGDSSLLKPLLDAGLASDGALSASLGDFYSNVLWKNPLKFVKSIYVRSSHDQHVLCRLAGRTDGSGMTDDMLRDVRHKLNRIRSQKPNLASVTKICLVEVNKANASNQ